MFKIIRFISIIVFLGCFFAAGKFESKAYCQTIHVILAADRADSNLGGYMKTDLENMIYLFRSNVPSANLNLVILPVEAMTPDGILKSVEDLNVDSNDTVVFYYSGHGAFDAKGEKQFLALASGNGLYRSTLLEKIEEKAPRLAVLLTDCCNNKVNVIRSKESGLAASRILKTPNSFSPLFDNLFVFCKGTADLTSSKPGEYSFVDESNPERGSCFTWALVEVLQGSKANGDLYWGDVVNRLAPKVQEAFSDAYPEKGYYDDGKGNKQTKQTVHVLRLPGMPAGDQQPEVAPTTQPTGPRLGLRAVDHDGSGVRITEIALNAPASKVGFIAGEIITEINGTVIRNETNYSDAVDNSPTMMEMKLKRADGSTRTVTVELGW